MLALAALAGGGRDPLWIGAIACLAAIWVDVDPPYFTLALGLAGAVYVLLALSPGRRGGSGRGLR